MSLTTILEQEAQKLIQTQLSKFGQPCMFHSGWGHRRYGRGIDRTFTMHGGVRISPVTRKVLVGAETLEIVPETILSHLTGIKRSTFQHWHKKGFGPRSIKLPSPKQNHNGCLDWNAEDNVRSELCLKLRLLNDAPSARYYLIDDIHQFLLTGAYFSKVLLDTAKHLHQIRVALIKEEVTLIESTIKCIIDLTQERERCIPIPQNSAMECANSSKKLRKENILTLQSAPVAPLQR